MSETALLSLPLLAAEQAQKHVTHNEALRALDAIVQLSVKDRDLTAPPGGEADGDRYIPAATATGAWAGRDGEIAAWQDGAWAFHPPHEGWRVWIEDEDVLAVFDGAAWIDLNGAISALQNLALLGIGTTADATNPFSAKLNKALWTAKMAAEGGDGDLRYTMNKEAAADIVSLLLQTGFSGRVEIGLIGDDDFLIKVSPDGSAWVEAVRIDKDDGAILLAANLTMSVPGGGNAVLTAESENFANNQVILASANANAPAYNTFKARGTLASPTVVQTSDILGRYRWRGHNGSAYVVCADIECAVIEPTPGVGALGNAIVFKPAPVGSQSQTEIMRLDHTNGLQMFGANPVIDANRHPRLRSYTVATLPSASPAGMLIYVSNGLNSKRLAVSDGTNWRFPDGNIVT